MLVAGKQNHLQNHPDQLTRLSPAKRLFERVAYKIPQVYYTHIKMVLGALK